MNYPLGSEYLNEFSLWVTHAAVLGRGRSRCQFYFTELERSQRLKLISRAKPKLKSYSVVLEMLYYTTYYVCRPSGGLKTTWPDFATSSHELIHIGSFLYLLKNISKTTPCQWTKKQDVLNRVIKVISQCDANTNDISMKTAAGRQRQRQRPRLCGDTLLSRLAASVSVITIYNIL